jgi:PAS domain S-box-containing protein
MSIYKRTIIMVCCTFLVLMALVYVISNVIYRQGFEELERQTVEKNINQVTDALSASLDALDTTCYNWAVWDDTYRFAQEYNQDYVDRNLQEETFASSRISLVSLINRSGEMVYCKAYDLINSKEIYLPDDITNILTMEGLATPAITEKKAAGIMLLTGQPMLVVSRPVLTSLAEGPSTGSIIVGRFLDAEVINHLSETTHLSVDLLPIPADNSNPEVNRIAKSLDKSGPMFIQPQNTNTIAGYTYVNDLGGNPAFIFEVVIPRDIYHQGTKAITLLHILLMFVGITFCIVFILLIKKLILSRLTKLSKNVSRIGSSGDVTLRVTMPGKDELSRLANNINDMLTSLENADKALRESEGKFSKAFRSSPQEICIMRVKDGKIIDVNESFTRLSGFTRDEVIGRTSTELGIWTKPDDHEKMLTMIRKNGRVQNEEYEFYRKSGEIRTQLFSAEKIIINGEECIISIMTDITERKRAEKLQADEIAVLTLLGQGVGLNELLDAIVSLGEAHNPAIRGSVLLFDSSKGNLVHAAGPSLPDDYKELLEKGVPIGPNSGSCGVAAYRKARVIVPDIEASHAYPNEVVVLTTKNGLHGCWSQPIIGSHGELLGTIAHYSIFKGMPSAGDLRVLEWSARITALAIERKKAEKALIESEEKFSKAFRASPDAISISRLSDGIFLEINDSYSHITGYTRGELIGQNADRFNMWANTEQRKNMLWKIREHIKIHNEEMGFRTKSGEINTVLVSTEYVHIGGELCLIVVSTDITERQKMEETLAKEATRRRILIEQSSDGIVILDQNGTVCEANRRFAEMLGYSPEEILKLHVWDWEFLYPPEQVSEMIRTVDEAGDHFKTQHRRKDGTIYDVEISTNGAMFAGQKLIFCVCRDISERTRMEKTIRESEEKFAKAFRASPAIVAITTFEDGKYVEVNDSYTNATGYSLKELIGQTSKDVNVWTKPEERTRLLKTLKEQGTVRNEEFDFRMKSGEICTWLFSAEQINIAGEPCLIGVSVDITERKKAEEKLKEAMANLEQSSSQLTATNKELEAFSYSVSHDLRSPLRSIDGFSQALLEDYQKNLDETGQNYLKRLRSASQKMGELIDGILKLSRLSRSEMHHVPIDLSALAEEIANRLQEMQPERRVKFAIAKDLTANGDPQLLRVLLENLLGNAWKFTSKKPQAKIEFSMEQNNGKKAYFIRDNGAGFNMTYADRLFRAFQRLHEVKEFPGTGIGLATVQRIIHRHGGSIWAEGAVGKGATFHFTLE